MATEKRLIDANFVYELHSNYPAFARSYADLTDLRDILDEAPTVDAVEVVRCKDCKEFCKGKCDNVLGLPNPYPDSFCPFGERRTDNG